MFSNFLFKHRTKDIELMIGKDTKGKPIVYVFNPVNNKKVYLKKFIGEWQYKQFLIEAFVLRMAADKKSVRKCRDAYMCISGYLKDENNERDFK